MALRCESCGYKYCECVHRVVQDLYANVKQLQAENERLKEALKQTDNNAFAIRLTCEQALKGGESNGKSRG